MPSEEHLIALVHTLGHLISHLRSILTAADVSRALLGVRGLLALNHYESLSSSTVTALQTHTITLLLHGVLPVNITETSAEANSELIPLVIDELIVYASYGCSPPPPPRQSTRHARARPGVCVPLALVALEEGCKLFVAKCVLPAVVHAGCAVRLLQARIVGVFYRLVS